ncbi:Rho Gtpase-Activating Protein 32 [Manis pentadactyla]|nr:Rho Gtpase-Activating Protein 32 [Manis pentadactyla]
MSSQWSKASPAKCVLMNVIMGEKGLMNVAVVSLACKREISRMPCPIVRMMDNRCLCQESRKGEQTTIRTIKRKDASLRQKPTESVTEKIVTRIVSATLQSFALKTVLQDKNKLCSSKYWKETGNEIAGEWMLKNLFPFGSFYLNKSFEELIFTEV